MAITRKVEVDAPVDYRIKTMVRFVQHLHNRGSIKFSSSTLDEAKLVELAIEFWDSRHGEY